MKRSTWHTCVLMAALGLQACAPGEEAAEAAGRLDDGASQEAGDTTEAPGDAAVAPASSWKAREPADIEWTQPRPDVVAAPPLVDSAATEPRLTVIDRVHRVVLPPAAYDALERGAPGFEPWTPGHYTEILFQYQLYDFDERQMMSAVVGDFDGDDRRDVVVEGRAGGDILTVALLSEGPSWRYQEIFRREARPGQLEASNSHSFLQYAPPGRYREPDYLGTGSVELEAAAFHLIHFEKSAELYYLRDGEWRTLALAD